MQLRMTLLHVINCCETKKHPKVKEIHMYNNKFSKIGPIVLNLDKFANRNSQTSRTHQNRTRHASQFKMIY